MKGSISDSRLAIAIALLGLLVWTPAAAEIVVYSEGFEGGGGGYTHTGSNDRWEWGTPSPVFTLGPGAAHSGSHCWGTDLDNHVPMGSDAYLRSPLISLPALAPNQIARLRVWAWIGVDEMYDRGEIQISSSALSWETVGELFHRMQGGWTEYNFDISAYADGPFYVRFRLHADSGSAFSQSPYNMAGLYVDDIAVLIADAPETRTVVTLEAAEDQYSFASCPWVYTWDGQQFVEDNDVYSTARGAAAEYSDHYRLEQPLVEQDGRYLLELRETEDEQSFTDLVRLLAIDHPAGQQAAPDEGGLVSLYARGRPPLSADNDDGHSQTGLVAELDGAGWRAAHEETLLLDFGSVDTSMGATLVLRVSGFELLDEIGDPTGAPARIYVETRDQAGNWVVRHELMPRWRWSTNAYELGPWLQGRALVRLRASSCHTHKEHLVDLVALDTSTPETPLVRALPLLSAVHSTGGELAERLRLADGQRVQMDSGQSLRLEFAAPAAPPRGMARSFVLVTRGYYVPTGTWFIYTWDGSGWAQRDSWSVGTSGDRVHDFDVSLWLPDPAGDWKVRFWQDYWYSSASADQAGITRGGDVGNMIYARDMRRDQDALTTLRYSDDVHVGWSPSDSGYPYDRLRNRWLEVRWDPFLMNTPPTTNPVFATDPTSPTPTLNWTYGDVDLDPQLRWELEVWTGPNATGSNVWDPPVGVGSDSSMVYAGLPLVDGATYWVRVKAYDGYGWGGWSEGSWLVVLNRPPIADSGGPYEAECEGSWTSLPLDGTGSSDPDDDPLEFLWTSDCPDASFDDSSLTQPMLSLYSSGVCDLSCQAELTVTDTARASDSDQSLVRVRDTSVPSLDPLPADIAVSCEAIPAPPPVTASDVCDPSPTLEYLQTRVDGRCPDSYLLEREWRSEDRCANLVSHLQLVEVDDTTAPTLSGVPTSATVQCHQVPPPPTVTARDNCDDDPALGFDETRRDGSCPDDYELTRSWSAEDACANLTVEEQLLTVVDTTAPELLGLPPDLTVECDAVPPPAAVTASDNCDQDVVPSFSQTRIDGDCPGNYRLLRSWSAEDDCGNLASHTQTIVVQDTTPPLVVESLDQVACLWPPNHRYACFGHDAFDPVISDNCSQTLSWYFDGCVSDQPDDAPELGLPNGDGHTRDDCELSADEVCARAERAGAGPEGRRYLVGIRAADECGNVSWLTDVGSLLVPHDGTLHLGCVSGTRD